MSEAVPSPIDQPTPSRTEDSDSRRNLMKGGALVAGALWGAPLVFDSFATPAAAAGTSLLDTTTPNDYPVTIPAGRTVSYTFCGGGGGGGSDNGGGWWPWN